MADLTEVERQFEAWFANHGYKFGLPKFEMLPVFFAGSAAGYEAGARGMREQCADLINAHAQSLMLKSNAPSLDDELKRLVEWVRSLPLTEEK